MKREAYIDGFLRVQKMCQSLSRPYVEYCDENILWKGTKGTECICQTDYCNSGSDLRLFYTYMFALILTYICNL
ncbi:unnamed protein product [Enterobius vermicularis]|uniref:Protein quiver n=1 Tax=Enterobius vermicularis TaxID=51028 RepID=A0A0N4UZI5_ENTVE|nr:unnamed protein product [Enterobius vermicularis]